jgi:hypothetical protein
MKANVVPLLAIFESKLRLQVPLFQWQYVWTREKHSEPLWEDLARKFAEPSKAGRTRLCTFLARWCSTVNSA